MEDKIMTGETENTEKKIHPAVELLLRRMETNPEEFNGINLVGSAASPAIQRSPGAHKYNIIKSNRWSAIYNRYKPHLSEEEQTMIDAAWSRVALENMYAEVAEELLREPQDLSDYLVTASTTTATPSISTSPLMNAGGIGLNGVGANSVTSAGLFSGLLGKLVP